MTRLRLDLAYDGGGFYGWARQPDLRTVQGTIEDALHKVLRVPFDDADEPLRLTVAGRTDTGVHASHQVAHLDVSDEVLARCVGHMEVPSTEALARRLKAVLPSDIVIHRVSVAPEGFDARFSALERTYVYRVADQSSEVDPRLRGCVLRVDETLDLDVMNQAAAMTIGLHDFGSFATPNPGGTTIREVKTAYWRRVPAAPLIPNAIAMDEAYRTPTLESGLITFTIVADAFARNMVRSLVGSCIKVGSGRKSLAWFAGKMAEPVREGSSGPIAPQGLTLEHIAYPADDQLAARAEAIRAVRTL
ncbi:MULTISPECIES: tRNA pseudouridine(38-40) synthase TruA [Bifidobacterium]|uniref:tRNA pseudouridine synthase A n=1 Tax=Bifidobacterium myosotis TaxID=1630166 RepID=A0A261FR91_9BIFI|nr:MULTISPECIES: tRNA pseudouridine(38-40) synthase TruA [Bifidobacterium]OZG61701.1 tRNA pseudouridine synthase A [Bifidobacterium myosotis]TPF95444.1 pseudouridine synthase [Bifidobacterium sp. UTBIF-78]